MALELNVASGAGLVPVEAALAHDLIGSLVVPPIGTGVLASSVTSVLTSALADYNEGLTGPGHCEEIE